MTGEIDVRNKMAENYQQEIEYRDTITKKAIRGIKITPEEREWCLSNPIYCLDYDEITYRVAVERLEPKTMYMITIKKEGGNYDMAMGISISAPAKKGYIYTDFDLYNIKRYLKNDRKTRMLGIDFGKRTECKVRFRSSTGLLSVSYEIEYYNAIIKNYRTAYSDSEFKGLCMKREMVNDNMVRYHCKSFDNNDFDALVFTIKWEKI